MAVRFNASLFLELPWQPPGAMIESLSMVGWFAPTSKFTNYCILSAMATTATNTANGFEINAEGGSVAGSVMASKTANGSFQGATTGSVTNPNVYTHVTGVFPVFNPLVPSGTQIVYANPGNVSATNPGATAFLQTPNRVTIGAAWFSGIRLFLASGLIAECAIIRGTVSPAQAMLLGQGVTPDQLFNERLLFYAPLLNDIYDRVSGRQMYNGGGAIVFGPHPPFSQLLVPRLYGRAATAAAVTFFGKPMVRGPHTKIKLKRHNGGLKVVPVTPVVSFKYVPPPEHVAKKHAPAKKRRPRNNVPITPVVSFKYVPPKKTRKKKIVIKLRVKTRKVYPDFRKHPGRRRAFFFD